MRFGCILQAYEVLRVSLRVLVLVRVRVHVRARVSLSVKVMVRVWEAMTAATMRGLFSMGGKVIMRSTGGEGRGWFQVRQTALVNRVGALHKIRCTISSCNYIQFVFSRIKFVTPQSD